MKVGIFDSGLGGLTILKKLIKKYPNNHYIYYGDIANLPYGNKNKDELITLVSRIIDYFIKREVDMIVIACGTICSTIYDELVSKYKIKLINVVYLTIDYLKEKKENITVLATQNTINTHIFKENLANVVEIACPLFVDLIEEDNLDNEKINKAIDKYLHDVEKSSIVLGCTHYPLIINNLKKYFNTTYYDMGTILSNNIILGDDYFKLEIYFSKIYPNLENKVKNILDKDVNIEKLTLD